MYLPVLLQKIYLCYNNTNNVHRSGGANQYVKCDTYDATIFTYKS